MRVLVVARITYHADVRVKKHDSNKAALLNCNNMLSSSAASRRRQAARSRWHRTNPTEQNPPGAPPLSSPYYGQQRSRFCVLHLLVWSGRCSYHATSEKHDHAKAPFLNCNLRLRPRVAVAKLLALVSRWHSTKPSRIHQNPSRYHRHR